MLTAEAHARDMAGPAPGAGPVGLLLVHGIGSQARGQSLDGLLAGLRAACGDVLVVERRAEDHAVLEGLGRRVHVVEVFWADLLHGETVRGTFDFDRVFEVVWFPLFNHRQGRFAAEIVSRAVVWRWTWILAPLSVLLSVGLAGARMLAAIPTGVMRARARTPMTHPGGGSFGARLVARVREARHPDAKRTLLDDVLDEVVGDVFNYVHGTGDAFPVASLQNDTLKANVAGVHARFISGAERAVAEGCTEIQVLAHSLGTVVAFRGMCPDTPAGPDAAARLTRFYTIGSPLEKFRFFWTRLVERPHHGPAIVAGARLVAAAGPGLRWDNFHSALDLVSGRLKPFAGWPAPVNHTVAGLGGLVTSHTSYTGSPLLIEMLLAGLTGAARTIQVPWPRRVRRQIITLGENLVAPVTLVALALFGLGILGGMAWFTGWLVATPLEWLGLGGVAQGVRIYFVASVLFVATVVSVGLGRSRARELHARFWAGEARSESSGGAEPA
ncbi:MAG: hypothetical protein Q8L86_20780 [Vicinamibacterales bacterium]|nr:hypothetical protein [Vicinamibacterales bacterium]